MRSGFITQSVRNYSERYKYEISANIPQGLNCYIISQSQITVGGSFQRSILKAVLLSVGIILVWMPGQFAFRLILGALQLVGFVLALSVWVLPWEDWFPGSAVYRGDASFFVRHAALISFLGFLATIATLVWGIVRSLGGTRFLKAEVAPTATEGD